MRAWLNEDAGRLLRMKPDLMRTVRDLQARLGEHEAEVSSLTSWGFANESQHFLHDSLVELLDRIEAFETGVKQHVEQRLYWAEPIGALTDRHPRARYTWEQARAALHPPTA